MSGIVIRLSIYKSKIIFGLYMKVMIHYYDESKILIYRKKGGVVMKKIIFGFSIIILIFLIGCGSNNITESNDTVVGEVGSLPYTQKNWMNKIGDSSSIADITIPGTHDSGAFYSNDPATEGWVLAQSLNISNQLDLGVRWLDVRVRAQKTDNGYYLGIYHENFYLNLSFDSVLNSAKEFLEANPSETVIVMIKQEDSSLNDTDFSKEIYKKLEEIGLDKFYLEQDSLPTMGEIRGKIVIFRRFNLGDLGHKMGYYLHWDDQTKGSDYHHNNYLFYVQDYYHIHTGFIHANAAYDDKITHVEHTINEAIDQGHSGKLFLNYTSCYSTHHTNKTVTSHINPSVDSYVKDRYHWGKAGVIFVNFAGTENTNHYDFVPHLVKHIIEINYDL